MRVSLPEQAWVDFEPAGFGSRSIAYIIDFLIRWFAITFITLAVFLLAFIFEINHTVFAPISGLSFDLLSDSTPIIALLIMIVFLIEWSYPIYFEVFRSGVSPGKAVMGLRVLDENGFAVSFKASLLRTILLIIDLLPGNALVAYCSILFSPKSQRLGDLIAHTIVVHEVSPEVFTVKGNENLRDNAKYIIPLELYNTLSGYLTRHMQLSVSAREKLATSIQTALESTCPNIPIIKHQLLSAKEGQLAEIYRYSAPNKITNAREKHDKTINWKRVEHELSEARSCISSLEDKNQLLSEKEIFSLAQVYQKLCQRYAYLVTFYPETTQAKIADFLVRQGRRLIYGTRLETLGKQPLGFLQRVNNSFKVIRAYTVFSTATFAVSAVVAFFFVQLNPNLSWYFLSEEMASQLTSGTIWTDQIRGANDIASSQIMFNNITVTINAFALGITAGIGTFLVLLINGAMLGGIFSALFYYNAQNKLLNFVVAHGFLEISIILCAGACGLYLGDAILNPGELSRKSQLRKHAREVLELVLYGSAWLVIAGLVEGYLSPEPTIPFEVKFSIGIILALV